MSNNRVYVIGICGPTCGGKTTVCEKILEKVKKTNESICIINQDSYYKGGDESTNYDIPTAIDFDLLFSHLNDLINGISVNVPYYDFSTHSRKNETKIVGPTKIILVEGILIFTQEKIRNLCDLKVFIQADEVTCFTRRLERDTKERGRTFKEVKKRYIGHVRNSNIMYVDPSKGFADIILMNNVDWNFVGLKILLDHIEKKIKKIR
jgi:uridine kinase